MPLFRGIQALRAPVPRRVFRKLSCDAARAASRAGARAAFREFTSGVSGGVYGRTLQAKFTGGFTAGGLAIAYGKAGSNRLKATGRMAASGS